MPISNSGAPISARPFNDSRGVAQRGLQTAPSAAYALGTNSSYPIAVNSSGEVSVVSSTSNTGLSVNIQGGRAAFGELMAVNPVPAVQNSWANGIFDDDIDDFRAGRYSSTIYAGDGLLHIGVGYLTNTVDALLTSIDSNSGLGGSYNGGTPYTGVLLYSSDDRSTQATVSVTLAADGASIASITVTNCGYNLHVGQVVYILAGALGGSSVKKSITLQAADFTSWELAKGNTTLLAQYVAATVSGASAGTYRITPTTSGGGSGAILSVTTTGATTISRVVVLNPGRWYAPGDTLVIPAAQLGGGSSQVSITLTAVNMLGAYSVARSHQMMQYRTGMGAEARFTALFQTSNVNGMWQLAGIGSQVDGLYVAMRDSVFNVMHQRYGRGEHVRMRFTTAASSTSTVTITLDGEAFTTTVTSGTSLRYNVSQIASRGKYYSVATTTSGSGTGLTLYVEVSDRGERISKIEATVVGSGYARGDTVTIASNALGTGSTAAVLTLDESAFDEDGLIRKSNSILLPLVTTDVTTGIGLYHGWLTEYSGNTVVWIKTSNAVVSNSHAFSAGSTGMTISTTNPEISQKGIASTQNWTAQSAFNVDTLDGTGDSGFTIDPSKGNVYRITYQYLGFGALVFEVENPDTGYFIPFHRIEYANANTVPNMNAPSTYCQLATYNVGYTSAFAQGTGYGCKLGNGSMAMFSQGVKAQLKPVHSHIFTNSVSVTTTEAFLFSIRNPVAFPLTGKHLFVAIELVHLFVSNEHTRAIYLRLYRRCAHSAGTSANYKNWTHIDAESVLLHATAPTTFAGGDLLVSTVIAAGRTEEIALHEIGLTLQREEEYVCTVQAVFGSVDATEIQVSLSWREDRT